MQIYTEDDVDEWVKTNNRNDADELLDEMLPKHKAKLDVLDRRIRKILSEIQEVFPDAQYYTASGGFNLVLGSTHDDSKVNQPPQQQRVAWFGLASIGDGDW